MAAKALVAAPLFSGFINVVFDRLMSPEVVNMIRGKKLDQELVKRLKTALRGAEALLVDAERKQFEDPHVKSWLIDLQDAVYNAGDSLDHVFTKAAIQNKVSTSWTDFLNFKDREMENKMVSKIEGEVRRIEDLLVPEHIPGLKEVSKDNYNYSSWRTPETSLVKGNIYGREADKHAIINEINDGSACELSVIPIVGMGGVGKTTLARWVYNNEDLMKEFALKVWVCISDDFDIVKVTKIIIEEITKTTCNLNNFNSLQLDLKEKLSKRKFFIVLDDVWNKDRRRWNEFKNPFQYGSKGSTVLVTTRSQDVAYVVQTCDNTYFLNGLKDEYCWSVFADNACLTESNGSPALEEIGREIAKKCKGSPLAAETLGCLLRTKRDVEEWKKVLKSEMWEIPMEDSKIIPALLISYFHLPAHLKSCFVYCSIFPKDHKFRKHDLILFWMAEDLLRPPKRGETLEEVGKECFDNLASRLFFKLHSHWFEGEYFSMHDLLHDLAMFLGGDFYCRLEEPGKAERISSQTRHLSYGSLIHPILQKIDNVESVRTFLQVNYPHPSFNIERMPYTHIILSKLKYLRVLSFRSFVELDLLPDSIDKLIHLRYLDLSFSSIKTLPESLSGLYNLQTLKLFGCRMLEMLPRGMCNLVNLRHLDIRETHLKEIPRGMSKLKHLHVLGHFAVGRQVDSAGINELVELSILDGTLELINLENVADCEDAMGARLMNKTHLDKLIMKWSDGADIFSSTHERDVFDKLQPHHGLKELKIYGYRGTRFPNWVGHSSYNNMTCVSLVSCTSCCILPSLGQLPSLESLYIKNFDMLENMGVEFYKNEDDPSSSCASPFPSLKNLTFRSMPCWMVWIPFDLNNAFPKLKSLEIIDCPLLEGDLPNHLPALKELKLLGSDKVRLQELPLSLERLSIGGCQQVESMCRAMSINHPTCLHSLTISNCLSAISLPWDFLAESLTSFSIRNCRELEFPSQLQQNHKLDYLGLDQSCDSLIVLQLEAFPKLEHLTITRCENLESISLSGSQHRLKNFQVTKCKKLKSLPSHMNTHLPNLQRLQISNCPCIDSFPKGGLPPSLETLAVATNCEKLLSNLSSIGVHESLTNLGIGGEDCQGMKSFPDEGLFSGLPSLTTMSLHRFPNLDTLECKQLLRLTSLQYLAIEECPNLQSIAGERLPESLLQLVIIDCPLLGERCKKKHEKIWPKISHIPSIRVNAILVS